MVEEDFNMLEIDMPRHPVPEPSDGEVSRSLSPAFALVPEYHPSNPSS